MVRHSGQHVVHVVQVLERGEGSWACGGVVGREVMVVVVVVGVGVVGEAECGEGVGVVEGDVDGGDAVEGGLVGGVFGWVCGCG